MKEKKVWSKAVAELLALHESFRRLNFPPEELFVDLYPGVGIVQFVLRHKSKDNFDTFTVDVVRGADVKMISDEWQEAAVWWNGPATEEERQEIYENAGVAKRRGDLAFALAKRGLIPNGH